MQLLFVLGFSFFLFSTPSQASDETKNLNGSCSCKNGATIPQASIASYPTVAGLGGFYSNCTSTCGEESGIINCLIGCNSTTNLVQCSEYSAQNSPCNKKTSSNKGFGGR